MPTRRIVVLAALLLTALVRGRPRVALTIGAILSVAPFLLPLFGSYASAQTFIAWLAIPTFLRSFYDTADRLLTEAALGAGDWRAQWYRGLIWLAKQRADLADEAFGQVRAAVPGELVPLLAQMGAWGRRHTPASEELSIRAQLLEEGGPSMCEALQAELRSLHLGAPSPQRSVLAELQGAFEAR